MLTTLRPIPNEIELPSAVTQVLRQVPDGRLRARLFQVFSASARAIARLRDLDLSRQEESAEPGSPENLEAWEDIAAAVAASVADVGRLLTVVNEQFPPVADDVTEADFDLAFSAFEGAAPPPPGLPATPAGQMRAAARAVRDIAEVLRTEASRFGARVRSPAVIANRWNLLVELQEFRGRCRAAIGELVFAACHAFGAEDRRAFVPEYDEDLAEGLAVREAVAALTHAIVPLNQRLHSVAEAERPAVLAAIGRELERFRATRGYRWMRAADKRFVIAFHRDLLALRSGGQSAPQEALPLVEGFSCFLESLAVINQRELLLDHDRSALAAYGILTEP